MSKKITPTNDNAVLIWYNPELVGIPEVRALNRPPSRAEEYHAWKRYVLKRNNQRVTVLSFGFEIDVQGAKAWAQEYLSNPRSWLQENINDER